MDLKVLKLNAEKYFENSKEKLEIQMEKFNEFLNLYPFHKNPEIIDSLLPDDIYNPGKIYFLKYIEHSLNQFGIINMGNVTYAINARKQINTFKKLLHISVDDSMSIAEKIDAPWEEIKYFGGDKHLAKKIIFCYNSEKLLPIYNTTHLEHFALEIDSNFKFNKNKFNESYDNLSIGEKFDYLNYVILKFKNESIKTEMNNVSFMWFLYEYLTPPDYNIKKWCFSVNMNLNPNFKEQTEIVWNSPKGLRKGDIILFYCGKPYSHIGDIFIADNNPYESKSTNESRKFSVNVLKKIELKNPIEWNELKDNSDLKSWQAIKMNFGKSHFKISNNAWKELKRLILEKNPYLENLIEDIPNIDSLNVKKNQSPSKNSFLKFIKETYNEEIQIGLQELKRGKNIIFFGPPGSGKTVLSKIISEKYLGKNAYSLYTVHSGTDYYDLVCRIVPQINGAGNLIYFKERRFLLDALLSGKVLILDEINRTLDRYRFRNIFHIFRNGT